MQCVALQITVYFLRFVVECGFSAGEFFIGYVELQFFVRDVDLNFIAILNKGNGPPAAASGEMWPTKQPLLVPEKRPSVIRAVHLFKPWP